MFSNEQDEKAMDELLDMCRGSKLVVNDGKYRGMRLLMPRDTKPIHTRVIVSAMHKLMRQKRSGELVYLLGCFFVAVSGDPGNPQVAQMKSKLTCVINWFAVCVFEEGCMLLINDFAQQTVVKFLRFIALNSMHLAHFSDDLLTLQVRLLVSMERKRLGSNWTGVIKYMMRIVSILDKAQRGRIISLVKSQALLMNPCSNELEEKVCKKMMRVLEMDWKVLMPKIARRWPVVGSLFAEGLCYRKNAELCKVINMFFNCLPLIGAELKMDFKAFDEHVQPRPQSENWLTEWGIENDLHILGVSEKSVAVFLEIGMCTNDTCNFQIGGLMIDVLEKNYVEQKKASMLVAIEEKQANKRKRNIDEDNAHILGKKYKREEKPNEGKMSLDGDDLSDILEAIGLSPKIVKGDQIKTEIDEAEAKMVSERAKIQKRLEKSQVTKHIDYVGGMKTLLQKDIQLVDLIGKIMGFKNATSKAIMKQEIGPFGKNCMVFVKVGESLENNDASLNMYRAMHPLKMPSVKVHVLPIVWDQERWERHSQANVTAKTRSWEPAMMIKMKSTVKKHNDMKLAVTMQICDVFKGVRMTWMKEFYPSMEKVIWECPVERMTFGKTLYEVIFFAVFVGAKDTGPFNTMVNEDGQVLLVGINIADEVTMLTYNTKCLFCSSRKYPEKCISAVICYINTHPTEAADFIVRLKKTATKNPYLLRNGMCPFFDKENIAILHSGENIPTK